MCPVCLGERFVTLRIASLTLRRCTGCALYIGAFAESKEAGYASIGATAYLDAIGVVRRTQSASIVKFVRNHLAQGDWLDVGCGFGYAVEAAQAAGYSARGIEPDLATAEAARRRGLDVTHGLLRDSTPPAARCSLTLIALP